MTFLHALIEYVEGIPLEKWNKTQTDIWKILISKFNVEENDVKKFFKLGEFFDSYYRKNKKFPSPKETATALGLT